MNDSDWSHFRDARQHKPEPGDVMARYQVMCEFGDGTAKRQLINLLRDTEKAEAAVQVMRKLHFAHQRDAIIIPLLIVRDMVSGMSVQEVAAKPYVYLAEMFFYVKPEYAPHGDEHWAIIPLELPKISCYVSAGNGQKEHPEVDSCNTDGGEGSSQSDTSAD